MKYLLTHGFLKNTSLNHKPPLFVIDSRIETSRITSDTAKLGERGRERECEKVYVDCRYIPSTYGYFRFYVNPIQLVSTYQLFISIQNRDVPRLQVCASSDAN